MEIMNKIKLGSELYQEYLIRYKASYFKLYHVTFQLPYQTLGYLVIILI